MLGWSDLGIGVRLKEPISAILDVQGLQVYVIRTFYISYRKRGGNNPKTPWGSYLAVAVQL